MPTVMEEILEYNKTFVAKGDYMQFGASKYPYKKLAVLSCMDARLVELLPAAMGLHNGDFKLIKNAGGTISHPFGSVMRSLLVAVYKLKVDTIVVVSHYNCGMQGLESKEFIEEMLERGVQRRDIDLISFCGFGLESWLKGFADSREAVQVTVDKIAEHPLMPKDITVHGFLMDPCTGRLDKVCNRELQF